jgi:hypothetical protein
MPFWPFHAAHALLTGHAAHALLAFHAAHAFLAFHARHAGHAFLFGSNGNTCNSHGQDGSNNDGLDFHKLSSSKS